MNSHIQNVFWDIMTSLIFPHDHPGTELLEFEPDYLKEFELYFQYRS